MAEKELRKMRRNELIDIIYALQEQMEQVAAEHVAQVMRVNLAEYLEKGLVK